MTKKKKTLLIALAIIIIVAIILFFSLRSAPLPRPGTTGETPCLVFQADDVSKPCFSASAGSIIPTGSGGTVSVPGIPIATSAIAVLLQGCAGETNVFERNECFSSAAEVSKNESICKSVSGALAKSACITRTKSPPVILTTPLVRDSYETFVRSTPSISPLAPIVPVSSSTSGTRPSSNFFGDVKPATDPRLTEEAFMKRLKEDAPLTLFGLSAYQVHPGEQMTFQGSGFTDANDIHFDGTVIYASSADGFTISGSAPGQIGVYEVWVTNSKGSSRSNERPIKVTVTDNPAPLPMVASMSPETPAYGDTVTVIGSGFSNSNTISTSLGPLLGVSSNGSSMQFKISDFPIAPLIKDREGVKGNKIPVQMYVQSDGGVTKAVFDFKVQF